MVEHRRRDDPAPDDPFRGLYLTDDDVDRLLAAPHCPAPPRDDAELQAVEQAAGPSRLRALQEAFGLTDLDVEILLVALAPDLDPRFERLYGYLNDDVTRRRATVGLALELGGRPADRGRRARAAAAGAPLRAAPARDRRGAGAPVPHPRPAGARPGGRAPARRPTTRTPR